MSKSLSSVAVEEFDSMVHQEYQGSSELDGTFTMRDNVTADTYDFRKIARGMANQKGTSDDVTPMDVAHSLSQATLSNWLAPEYTDIFDQAEVNFDEKLELAQVIAMALGRREDQIKIDALDASTPGTTTVGTAIGGAASGLNKAKVLRAASELNKNGVPRTDRKRFAAVTAQGIEGLLNTLEVTSTEYVQVQALISGELTFWMGFNWKMIDDRSAEEGGLTKAGAVVDSWFWHADSMGMARAIPITTEVNYVPTKTAWLSNGFLKAGAVNRDPKGIVKVQYTET
jgi:hypothetical protein